MYLVEHKLGKGGFGQVYTGKRQGASKDAANSLVSTLTQAQHQQHNLNGHCFSSWPCAGGLEV